MTRSNSQIHRTTVDYVPVIWCEPGDNRTGHVAVWLNGMGGRKDDLVPYLEDLAARGFLAVSFDTYQHGERMPEAPETFWPKVHANKRRYFWPMMANTIDELPRILDWAAESLGADGKAVVGGISMGGDIAVAAAGLDPRIVAVAACISTPDWLRPGTDETPSKPDTYAWNCYRRFNPLTNIGHYGHCPAIVFENGADDGHVPPDGARRFERQLRDTYAACPERLAIREHPVAHRMIPQMWDNALEWFCRHV